MIDSGTGDWVPRGCYVPPPGYPSPYPSDPPSYPSLPPQQGWACPKCGQVWAPSFAGPCPCSVKTTTTTKTNQFGFKECDHHFPIDDGTSSAKPSCIKCGQYPLWEN